MGEKWFDFVKEKNEKKERRKQEKILKVIIKSPLEML